MSATAERRDRTDLLGEASSDDRTRERIADLVADLDRFGERVVTSCTTNESASGTPTVPICESPRTSWSAACVTITVVVSAMAVP